MMGSMSTCSLENHSPLVYYCFFVSFFGERERKCSYNLFKYGVVLCSYYGDKLLQYTYPLFLELAHYHCFALLQVIGANVSMSHTCSKNGKLSISIYIYVHNMVYHVDKENHWPS